MSRLREPRAAGAGLRTAGRTVRGHLRIVETDRAAEILHAGRAFHAKGVGVAGVRPGLFKHDRDRAVSVRPLPRPETIRSHIQDAGRRSIETAQVRNQACGQRLHEHGSVPMEESGEARRAGG
jgi:hypothetical protein